MYQYRRELFHLARHIGDQTNRPRLEEQVPKVGRPQARETIATPQDIERLKAVAKGWMRLYITIVTSTALRRSDVLRLSQSHISADASGPYLVIKQKKTERRVTIPLARDLEEAIEALPPAEDPATPFLERAAGKPVTVTMFGHEWKATRKRAGINPDLTGHDLRRTVAVSLYDVSKDLRVVQEMLGHANLSSTLAYLEHRDPAKIAPLLQQIWRPRGPVQ